MAEGATASRAGLATKGSVQFHRHYQRIAGRRAQARHNKQATQATTGQIVSLGFGPEINLNLDIALSR